MSGRVRPFTGVDMLTKFSRHRSSRSRATIALITLVGVMGAGGCKLIVQGSDELYCQQPAPLTGYQDGSQSSYLIYFNDGVELVSEINRLTLLYEMEVGALYPADNGVYVSMRPSVRDQLRCESSVQQVSWWLQF